jgi:hypothetical protein
MLTFDRALFTHRLDGICARSRTVFALSCAERLLPLYEAFSAKSTMGRWNYLRSVSNKLWDLLLEGIVCTHDDFLAEYPSLAPGDDTPRSERTLLDPLAENAVLALGSAWECHVCGQSEKAFWAAEQAFEAMDYMAQNVEDIDYGKPDGEEALRRSGFVQGELKRQLDSLTTLEQISECDLAYVTLVKTLREHAEIDGVPLKTAAETLYVAIERLNY